jgi:hypothetical protein
MARQGGMGGMQVSKVFRTCGCLIVIANTTRRHMSCRFIHGLNMWHSDFNIQRCFIEFSGWCSRPSTG